MRRRMSFTFTAAGWAAAAGMGLALTGPASAAFIYVDANHTTNTTASTAFAATNTNADDNLWTQRTVFASSGTIYESGQGDGENSPEIVTTITGLAPSTAYTIYVHFWDGSGTAPDWNVRAGLSSNPGANTLFANPADRSEERRVGKECRSRGSPDHYDKKE